MCIYITVIHNNPFPCETIHQYSNKSQISKEALANKPASGNMTFRYLACTSMQLKEIPHLLTENTTSRNSYFTLYTMAEKPLNFPTVWILTMGRAALRCMHQEVKHLPKLQNQIARSFQTSYVSITKRLA